MKFQVQTVVALGLASGAAAFCPAPIPQRPATAVAMAARQPSPEFDLGKAAMSFVAASVVAVSASNTILPVEPAFAATATAAASAPKVEKVEVKKVKVEQKLAPEERNKVTAKKNLDLAEQTLKEYQKYVSEAKGTESKASAALKAQEKVAAASKKAAIADSDKLSSAKNQNMPQTAIKELTVKAGK